MADIKNLEGLVKESYVDSTNVNKPKKPRKARFKKLEDLLKPKPLTGL